MQQLFHLYQANAKRAKLLFIRQFSAEKKEIDLSNL